MLSTMSSDFAVWVAEKLVLYLRDKRSTFGKLHNAILKLPLLYIEPTFSVLRNWLKLDQRARLESAIIFERVHGEFVNHAAIGIWNRPRQWCRQA